MDDDRVDDRIDKAAGAAAGQLSVTTRPRNPHPELDPGHVRNRKISKQEVRYSRWRT